LSRWWITVWGILPILYPGEASVLRFDQAGLCISIVLVGLTVSGGPRPPAPIQRLKIEETSAGPVIRGLFDRPSLPFGAGCRPNGQCKCFPGSNSPSDCCEFTKSVSINCYPCLTCSICEGTANDKCCCECIQTTGNCSGAPRTGYGCG